MMILLLLAAQGVDEAKATSRASNRVPGDVLRVKADDGFRPIFDGKTLEGWSAPDLSYFSVRDGAITGEVTADRRPPRNQFIVWTGGTVKDFELKFKFRIEGAKANSGMQFRGTVKEHGLIHGYQADIAKTGPYLGGIWDEYGTRNSLCARGKRVAIDEAGKRTEEAFADPLAAGLDLSQWNDYKITARGSKIALEINGKVTAELDDRQSGKAAAEGVLGMPVIPEPMVVQYKEILLKDLK